MEVRNTIFGSQSEKRLFQSIHSQWSKHFDLWPSLPLSSVINIDKNDGVLSSREIDFFYKTSVDYTLCTKEGSPILTIEFDGLGKGFNRNGEYVQIEESHDRFRKLKLDMKIRLAERMGYPFFIVSFEEAKDIDKELNLTIVDGIIGQVLKRRAFTEMMKEAMVEAEDQIDELPSYAKEEYIQDLVWQVETIAELRWDPIVKLASIFEEKAFAEGLVKSYSVRYLNDPELIDGDPFIDPTVLERNIELIKSANRVGCRIIIDTPKVAIIETVWLRNFGGFVSPLHIANNIAHLIGFKRTLDLLRGHKA